jgi:glycyl-tRNA synthetase beta subunit
VAAAAADLGRAEKCGEYETVFDILSSFGPAIDAFFDQVRVNVEDDDLRARRHAFLREIHGLFARYADFRAIAAGEA